jgi:hypothetical protein
MAVERIHHHHLDTDIARNAAQRKRRRGPSSAQRNRLTENGQLFTTAMPRHMPTSNID